MTVNDDPHTWELPPEPPVGTVVRDVHGALWERMNNAFYGWGKKREDGSMPTPVYNWLGVLDNYGPLTEVTPEPEPVKVGDVFTMEADYMRCPVGTVIVSGDNVARRIIYGWEFTGDDSRYSNADIVAYIDAATVVHVPEAGDGQ